MSVFTVRIEIDTCTDMNATLDAARDAFPDASSVCVEALDGTSETIYTRKDDA